ncbi:ML domain-containing protein [Mycena filopes]|nr:ML domain-containing protein [Mycena filopes]
MYIVPFPAFALLVAAVLGFSHVHAAAQNLDKPSSIMDCGEIESTLVNDLVKLNTERTGTKTDAIQLKSVTILPSAPKQGQNVTLSVEFNATQTIKVGAYGNVTVGAGSIEIWSAQFDLCAQMKEGANMTCPIKQGYHTFTLTRQLPGDIPSAIYSAKIRTFTAQGRQMTCFTLFANFTQ